MSTGRTINSCTDGDLYNSCTNGNLWDRTSRRISYDWQLEKITERSKKVNIEPPPLLLLRAMQLTLRVFARWTVIKTLPIIIRFVDTKQQWRRSYRSSIWQSKDHLFSWQLDNIIFGMHCICNLLCSVHFALNFKLKYIIYYNETELGSILECVGPTSRPSVLHLFVEVSRSQFHLFEFDFNEIWIHITKSKFRKTV